MATSSKLLEQTIHGARGLLVNITSGEDMTLSEVTEAMAYIHSLCDEEEANIYFGTVIDPMLEGEVRITVLATGFNGTSYRPIQSVPVRAVVETPLLEEEPEEVAAELREDSPRNVVERPVFNDKRISPREIWERAQAGLREANTQTEDLYDENEIDIPAFLRDHRQKKQ
jgi:cell division protein FtsZ